jgi:hypothetical protein
MKKQLSFLRILFLIFSVTWSANAEDDLQYWSQYLFKVYSKDKVSVSFYSEGRLTDDLGRLGYYQFTPQVRYAVHKNLDFQLNCTYLETRNNNQNNFTHQARLEPEINPHFTFGNGLEVYFRNRMEFRSIEDKGSDNTRYRGRVRMTVPVKNIWRIRSVFADTELFYDFTENDHLEQRTIPFGLNLKLCDAADLQLFYMVQHRRDAQDWSSNQILGSMVTFKF